MIDVLLIDSESRNLQELATGLRIQSHKLYVLNAVGAEKAVQYLRTVVFDVIVTDLNAQDVELFHYIQEKYPHIPVIVMSSTTVPSGSDRMERLPFATHLKKNLDLDAVAHAILSVS